MNRRSVIQLLIGIIAMLGGLGALTVVRQNRCVEAGGQWSMTQRSCTGPSGPLAVDRWSDIDLGLGLAAGAELTHVIEDWTRAMYAAHGAVAHVDLRADTALYRAFLLASTLQVDLSFWPAGTLAPMGEAFRLAFGGAGAPRPAPVPTATDFLGMAWLHALHVRSATARGRSRAGSRRWRHRPAWCRDSRASASLR